MPLNAALHDTWCVQNSPGSDVDSAKILASECRQNIEPDGIAKVHLSHQDTAPQNFPNFNEVNNAHNPEHRITSDVCPRSCR